MTHRTMNRVLRSSLKAGVASLPLIILFAQAPANAQTETAAPGARDATQTLPETPPATPKEDKDIVVTGSSIRGIATVGNNEIVVSQEDIKASGANSASEVLATVPQLTGNAGAGTNNFFNAIPQLGNANLFAVGQNAQTEQRPNLRPVPGGSGDSGNSTLILIDGNRTAGSGVNSNSASPDSVPPALLQRVELDTDGASAIYGSDAIAGVINFITVRKFDGMQATAHYGFADHYYTWDATAIVGKDWGSGSAFISYSHAYADPLYQKYRSYVDPIDFGTGLNRDLNCDTPNVRVAANSPGSTNPVLHYYASTGTGVSSSPFTVVAPVVGSPNVCLSGRDAALSNGARRDNVFASVAEDIGALKLTLRGHYNYNASFGVRQMSTYTGTVNNTNPFFIPLTGADANVHSYSVLGSFSESLGRDALNNTSSTKEYGGVLEADYDISSKWQVRGTAVYDMSDSTLFIQSITAANVNNGFDTSPTSTCAVSPSVNNCLNPFNMSASNPALLANLLTSEQMGVGHDKLLDLKAVADGPLFPIFGNDIKLAFGVEYLRDQFTRGNYTGLISGQAAGLVTPTATTSDIAGFAELNIPLVTANNAMPLIRDVRISASGRYDDYAQFGGTFNPRVGASYKPFDWLKIRGSWSTSFRAPSAIDILGEGFANSTVGSFGATLSNGTAPIFTDPNRPIPASIGGPTSTTAMVLVLQGTDPNLKPQTGDGYSIAVEFTPIKRLFASIDFYRNDYYGQFGQPCQGTPCFPFLGQFENVLYDANGVQNPNAAALVAAFEKLGVGGTNITTPLNQIYGLVTGVKTNLGNSYVTGLDYQLRYSMPTGFGSVFGSVSGNVQLVSRSQPVAGLPYINNFLQLPASRHSMVVQLGMLWGGLRTTATLDHSDGYPIVANATTFQSKVDSYNVVNFAATYDFKGSDLFTKGLELSVTINNLLDQDPPILRQTGSQGYANGSTLGRVVMFGIQKKI